MDPVFSTFSRDKEKVEGLKFAVKSVKKGYAMMNFGFLQINEMNARAQCPFSRATCQTTQENAIREENKQISRN